MLEARKLSAQVNQDLSGGVWSWLLMLIWVTTVSLVVSVWIGVNFEAPPPDKSQEKMTEAHVKVLEVVGRLSTSVAPEQELNAETFEQLAMVNAPLLEFGQLAARGLNLPPDTKDRLTWPGKVNVLLDDLKIVSDGQESLLSYFRVRDLLLGLYKPKGPLNPKQFAEGSAGRGFFTAISDWALEAVPVAAGTATATSLTPLATPKLTWATLAKGQSKWREINAQLDALEMEAKQVEDPARAKVAKELVALLVKNDLMQTIRKADDAWGQVILAQERLHNGVGQLPSEPKLIVATPPWHWSRLAFPGSISEGLLASVFMMVLGLTVAGAGYVARRQQLQGLSKRWLTVSQQLETAVRSVDAPLTNAVTRIEALSAEFALVIDKLKSMQQAIKAPADAPPKTLEAQAWDAASRMQIELESDLNLLREKLLNIHLQFCSGQTHENLVYDLAFTTEAVQTVFVTARDLGRSVSLLKDSLQQVEAAGDAHEIEILMTQVIGLRNSAKRIAITLQELSAGLQVAVEDVPKGRRFDADGRTDETGRPRVNQPI